MLPSIQAHGTLSALREAELRQESKGTQGQHVWEAKRGCQVVHRWQNQVRCVEESPCSLAEGFVSSVRGWSPISLPLLC